MKLYALTTLWEGEAATTLHLSKEEAEAALAEAVRDITMDYFTPTMETVNDFFIEQGAGYSYDISEAELPRVLTFSEFRSSMTEDEFSELWHEAQSRFGYSGTYFQRGDANAALNADKPLTDEEWETVRGTWEWRHMTDFMVERVWPMIEDAVSSARPEESTNA